MKDQVKEPLRFVNGKFMRGNVEVPPEIGNIEQIVLLQKAEREVKERMENAKTKGIPVSTSIEERSERCYSVLRFECICGAEVREREFIAHVDDLEDDEELEPIDYDGEVILCPQCQRKYKIDYDKAKYYGQER